MEEPGRPVNTPHPKSSNAQNHDRKATKPDRSNPVGGSGLRFICLTASILASLRT
jgi:hypothetical protein